VNYECRSQNAEMEGLACVCAAEDLPVGGDQQLLGVGDPIVDEVIEHRHPKGVLEQGHRIVRPQPDLLGHLGDRSQCGEVGGDVARHLAGFARVADGPGLAGCHAPQAGFNLQQRCRLPLGLRRGQIERPLGQTQGVSLRAGCGAGEHHPPAQNCGADSLRQAPAQEMGQRQAQPAHRAHPFV